MLQSNPIEINWTIGQSQFEATTNMLIEHILLLIFVAIRYVWPYFYASLIFFVAVIADISIVRG